MSSQPVIINVAFEELFARMAQCGYRHVLRAREDITAMKSAFPSLTAHLAQISGQPPLFMVKGQLFPPSDLRGQPQIEFVVTFTQAYPNSYPIVTVEGPPSGWSFKRHPNVDFNGCCFLQSVSRWDPRSSRALPCVQELQAALRMNHPFQSASGAQSASAVPPPAPVPAPAAQPQPVRQAPTPATAPVAPAAPAASLPQPLGAPQPVVAQPVAVPQAIPMPQQTLAVGQMIFCATNATNGRSDPEMQRQREHDQRWLADYQRRQQTDPANRAFAAASASFQDMLTGKGTRPGSTVECPLGFGLHRIQTAADATLPLRSLSGVPHPLPPCPDPTPDQQYRKAEADRAVQRAANEAAAKSAPKSTSAFGSLSRALNIGATVVGNLASQAVSSVESEVRKSEAAGELRRFATFFPQFGGETLAAEYNCHALMGNGIGVYGALYVTDGGLHFTTKRFDNVPPPIVFQFDISYNQIASVVKGSALSHEWLHLMYDDGQFRSVYNVVTSTTAAIGEVLTTSVSGSAYSRLYSWVDHKWRPKRFGGAGYGQPLQPAPALGFAPPPVAAVPTAAVPTATTELDQCVVCMERQKNQFFQPCGHVCCCQVCASNVRECPLCRAPIQQAFQAFL